MVIRSEQLRAIIVNGRRLASVAIEYSSDVLVGLIFWGAGDSKTFDIDAAKEKNQGKSNLRF